jgi:pimeloyl-ACP methyl ester carboxylesterase
MKLELHHIDGKPLSLVDLGPGGGGAPLVLLHGLGRSVEDWYPSLPRLAEARRVLAPDLVELRGERPDLVRLAARVVGLLAELGLPRAHWVGSSLGGHLAAWAALEHPGRISSLTLLGSLPAAGRLARVGVPIQLVLGADDPLARQGDAAGVAALPGVRVVWLPGCGHLPALESPEAFCDAVERFLEVLV